MIHAYDKSYLSAAQKNLARMLDYLVNDLHYPLETAWQWFVTSELSARFEQGDCSVLVGLSGVELARAVLEQAGEVVSMQKPSYAYDRSPEYWTGWCACAYHPAVRTATEGHQQSTSRNAASPCACAELQRGGSDGESSTAEFYRKARK